MTASTLDGRWTVTANPPPGLDHARRRSSRPNRKTPRSLQGPRPTANDCNPSSGNREHQLLVTPRDFAKIPPDSPKGNVLASMPGTEQVREAVVANQIPQTTALRRTEVKFDVRHDSMYSSGSLRARLWSTRSAGGCDYSHCFARHHLSAQRSRHYRGSSCSVYGAGSGYQSARRTTLPTLEGWQAPRNTLLAGAAHVVVQLPRQNAR